MDADRPKEQDTRGGAGPPERRYVTVHCPSGEPGAPHEVLAVDGTPLASFVTPAEAEALAAREAHKASATVDEAVFRHNRRGSPMSAFQTLLGLGTQRDPVPLGVIRHASDLPQFPITP